MSAPFAIAHALRHERADLRYPLVAGAEARVQPDDRVNAGAVLARLPAAPVIVPFAADLDLPPEAVNSAVMFRDNVAVERGNNIARHRGGLRTRTLAAPVGGTLHRHPDTGMCTIATGDVTDLIALRGGIVSSVDTDAITVSTTIERLRCAFAAPQRGTDGTVIDLTNAPNNALRLPGGTRDAIVLVAHVTEMTQARALQRQGAVAIIAGAVSDAVAWEVVTARARGDGQTNLPPLLVIFGPGSAARGATSVAPLRSWQGQRAWVTHDDRGVSVIVETGPMPRSVTSEAVAGTQPEMRDPAHWGQRATPLAAPAFVRGETGARALAVTAFIEEEGRNAVPLQNLAF